MKEVSSCQENIDTEVIGENEKKSWIGCLTKWAFLLTKSVQLSWNVDLESESMSNYTELIAEPIGPFASYLIVWTALFFKIITVAFCGRGLPS